MSTELTDGNVVVVGSGVVVVVGASLSVGPVPCVVVVTPPTALSPYHTAVPILGIAPLYLKSKN